MVTGAGRCAGVSLVEPPRPGFSFGSAEPWEFAPSPMFCAIKTPGRLRILRFCTLAVELEDSRAPGSSIPFSSTRVSGISSTLGRATDALAPCGAPNVLTATDATASAAKGVLILIVQALSRKSGSEANAEAVAGNDAPTFQNCYIYFRRVELRIRK